MKYHELINFEPITEVVKFSKTAESDYQEALIKTFVFSKAYKENLIPLIIRNLDLESKGESFGLHIVGNYGTGKSHLMALIWLIAENKELLSLISESKPRKDLEKIAGKFKVLKFELGNEESLWEVISFKIEAYLSDLGITFSFDGHGPLSYSEKIQLMMAEFEEKYPDKGFLLVIDEMLAYLKGRSTSDKLNSDLQVLQALGQASDSSKFKFMFGVQEMIYHSPEFQFAAEMLQKVNDRYKDIMITKEDVAFIVKTRLLKKNEHQKQKIKEHLDPFLKFFTDLHARTQDYIDLFPVHPTYFENFQRIRIGKSQREILKVLSNQFSDILDKDVPSDNPGLLTYDKYWQDIQSEQDMMAIPDVRKIKEITDIINEKLNSYFVGARTDKKQIAEQIANATAIKILQDDLNKQNGTNTEHLVDDLCLTHKMASDREFLIDIMESTAQQIIKATSGQYFDKDPNNAEYHLRVEGGINFDQKIKDYAATMPDTQKDEFYFKFLEVTLPLVHETYRTGFKIWEHSIEWKSHKTFCEGYIFFGNPGERSTTHPRQHFYMYFMPIFGLQQLSHQPDEVYFSMNGLSDEFKNAVTLYGAAVALEVQSDSSQKKIYQQKIDELTRKARAFFEQEYIQITRVDYMGKETPLSGYSLPGAGATKEQIFSDVASLVLDKQFEEERPEYPKFTQLKTPIAKDNFHRFVRQSMVKIIAPDASNRDGEGILSGLGLWVPGMLDFSHSPYAKNILGMLTEKDGKVLNRDEILKCTYAPAQLWISKDFKLESELEFVVLATLAALGEIEINLTSGKSINSTNLPELRELNKEDFYSFSHIKPPKGINLAALKALFTGLLGRDLSHQLKNPGTYVDLVGAAEDWAKRTVTLQNKIQRGYTEGGVEIVSEEDATEYGRKFKAFAAFCDKLANYTTEAKMKNFQFSVDDVNRLMETKTLVTQVEKRLKEVDSLSTDISYLQQCRQYITDPEFKKELDTAIDRLGNVLSKDNKAELEAYKTALNAFKDRYAKWYWEMYLKYRLSDADHTQKTILLDSDEKAICDSLKEAEFLPEGQYHDLLNKLNKLLPADSRVKKELILTAPYQDFDPKEFEGIESISIKQFKEELSNILERWEEMLKEMLADPAVKKKLDLFDQSEIALLNDFKSGNVVLTKNNAGKIRTVIMDLYRGLEKIELSLEGMKTTFNKPLTPDEAIEAFKTYIDGVSKGKERDKIRIILK